MTALEPKTPVANWDSFKWGCVWCESDPKEYVKKQNEISVVDSCPEQGTGLDDLKVLLIFISVILRIQNDQEYFPLCFLFLPPFPPHFFGSFSRPNKRNLVILLINSYAHKFKKPILLLFKWKKEIGRAKEKPGECSEVRSRKGNFLKKWLTVGQAGKVVDSYTTRHLQKNCLQNMHRDSTLIDWSNLYIVHLTVKVSLTRYKIYIGKKMERASKHPQVLPISNPHA